MRAQAEGAVRQVTDSSTEAIEDVRRERDAAAAEAALRHAAELRALREALTAVEAEREAWVQRCSTAEGQARGEGQALRRQNEALAARVAELEGRRGEAQDLERWVIMNGIFCFFASFLCAATAINRSRSYIFQS